MEEKLKELYIESINELNKIGINISEENIGKIEIELSTRNNKRYGCCKQEEPDKSTIYYEKIKGKKFVRYRKYKMHKIEISKWVMELEDKIIKNTIIHEIIHCLPNCNNHGTEFKKYAEYINKNLGYNISRLGNRREDFEKSNLKYQEKEKINYKIVCENCKQTFYRQRLIKNLTKKYKCGKCGGKLIVYKLLPKVD